MYYSTFCDMHFYFDKFYYQNFEKLSVQIALFRFLRHSASEIRKYFERCIIMIGKSCLINNLQILGIQYTQYIQLA